MKLILNSKDINNLVDNNEIALVLNDVLKFENKKRFKILHPTESKYSMQQIQSLIKGFGKKIDSENEYAQVIMHSEKLSDIHQNALLKSLEESLYSIILITSNTDSLLPTLISRCQVLNINSSQSITSNVSNIDLKEITSLSKLSREEIIIYIESKMNNNDIYNIINYQEAINKINSNCKVESVLYELVFKLKGV